MLVETECQGCLRGKENPAKFGSGHNGEGEGLKRNPAVLGVTSRGGKALDGVESLSV